MYRKPTNRDDFIHFLSTHDRRAKSGVVRGFFLRAFRVCSDFNSEFIMDELVYIRNSFIRLGYLKGLLYILMERARNIFLRK